METHTHIKPADAEVNPIESRIFRKDEELRDEEREDDEWEEEPEEELDFLMDCDTDNDLLLSRVTVAAKRVFIFLH